MPMRMQKSDLFVRARKLVKISELSFRPASPLPLSASVAPRPAAADRTPAGQSDRVAVDDEPDRKTSTDPDRPTFDSRPSNAPLLERSQCERPDADGSHGCCHGKSARRSAPELGARPVEPPCPLH